MTILERFWGKVSFTETCWIWMGNTNKRGGYGHFRIKSGNVGKTKMVAHRMSWELLTATEVPDGLELDHTCRNHLCVNPSHLEPVTHLVNILRGESPGALNARKTHCKNGHEFNEANTYTRSGTDNNRQCRVCRRAIDRQRYLNDPLRSRKYGLRKKTGRAK